MATHSSVPAWRIQWTEETGGLYSPQCHKASDTTEATKHSTCKTLISGFRLIEYSAKESQNISNFLILRFDKNSREKVGNKQYKQR